LAERAAVVRIWRLKLTALLLGSGMARAGAQVPLSARYRSDLLKAAPFLSLPAKRLLNKLLCAMGKTW